MKIFLKTTGSILATILLVGCSSAASVTPTPVENNDHHKGEVNVDVHGHDAQGNPVEEHHDGEANIELHDDSEQDTPADHHEGEENVEPHDDSKQDEPEDHHEGEENVEPHDDIEEAILPPSRSNLEKAPTSDPVEPHEDDSTDPHGH